MMKMDLKNLMMAAGGVLLLSAVVILSLWPKLPLDLSKDEAPFPSILMPPKAVYASGYMDGGSVFVLIIDRSGTEHELTFPIDYDGIINSHPTAFSGNFDDPGMTTLKNPKRAKEIAIRLIDEFGREMNSPSTLVNDQTARARRALGSSPDVVAIRAFDKMMRNRTKLARSVE